MAGLEVDDRMTPRELRADVPALGEAAYFNFGAHGPSPEYVVEAASEFLADHEYGSATTDPYSRAFETYETVRERVADFVGAEPDEIALTESTTDGITRIAGAIDWEPGDVVVRTDLEHPAGILPWKRLEREGVEVRVVETEEGRIDREAYAEAVADARLVCFSAITWTHGTRLPVADLVEIADEAGAFTLVDAVQSPGQVAMDVSAWGAPTRWRRRATSGCSARGEPGSSTSTARPRPSWRRARSATGASRIPTPTDRVQGGCEALRGRIDDPGRPRRADRGARRDRRGRDRDDRRPDRVAHGPAQRRRPRRPSAEPREYESGLVTIDVDDPEATVDRLADEDRRSFSPRTRTGPGVGPRRLHRGRDRPARRAARRRVVSARSDAF